MSEPVVHVGIDVSKHTLVIDPFDGKKSTLPNTSRAIQELIERIENHPQPITICCEATGGYERLLVAALIAARIAVAVINPKRVRDFARSQGILAKTDGIDAAVISAFGRQNQPRTHGPVKAAVAQLQPLLVRRDELLEMIQQEQSRLDPPPPKPVATMIRSHLRSLQLQLKRVEKTLQEIAGSDPELRLALARLCRVKSIGTISALYLLGLVPELGSISDNQAAALTGLAPFNNDSGMMRGKRSTWGGRARVRRVLYMCAVCASHANPVLRDFYQRLLARGKPPKVALTAVMRKLVVLANRIMADPSFQPV